MRWTVIAGIFLSLFLTGSSSAETRAMLVGAFEYDNSFGISDLKGPKNDIEAIAGLLKKRGVTDVRIYLDSLDPQHKATRQNILDGFRKLAEDTAKGDFIYIHMSGHGSRQLDMNNDERDGLDEIFLPSDIGKPEPGANQVPNALIDDEIGEIVAALRRKGADVWFVLDSCHSGSGMRDASSYSLSRNVTPDVFGIDTSVRSGSQKRDTEPFDAPLAQSGEMGNYLAFYAARSTEVAREIDFSKGTAKGDEGWYGLFTSVLLRRLEQNPDLSYRQLFQAMLSDINNDPELGQMGMQTPSWEGNLIDSAVFGGEMNAGVHRFLVNGDEIDGGLIQGIRPGTLIGLMDGDLTQRTFLGFAQVEEAEPRIAYLRPVAEDCQPTSQDLCEAEGNLPEGARFGEVVARPMDMIIRFSPVLDFKTGAPVPSDAPVAELVRSTLQEVTERAGIAGEQAEGTYDVQVLLDGKTLWFGPRAHIEQEPAGLSFRLVEPYPENRQKLSAVLLRILKAELFAKAMDSMETEPSLLSEAPLEIEASLSSSDIRVLAPPGRKISAKRECRAAYRKMDPSKSAPLQSGQDLKQCDMLQFTAQGKFEDALDLNRIHIDAQYCIHPKYELVDGSDRKQPVGAPTVVCSDCPPNNQYSAGYDRVYFIASKVRRNTESFNLEGQIENCFGDEEGSRGAETKGLFGKTLKAISDKSLGSRSGFSFDDAATDVWVKTYRWRTLPRSIAFTLGN
jgi:hypothetical protein